MTVSNSLMLDVLFIDNFDSFTFNMVDELARRGARVDVWRNDIALDQALDVLGTMGENRLVILSPGPGAPAEAGCCIELVQRLAGQVPIFGICLGHQVIIEAFGGQIIRNEETVHGKTSTVSHEGTGLFQGLSQPLKVGRYHSLVGDSLPDELRVTARLGETVMAVEHRDYRVAGVQFHPESILTPEGGRLIENLGAWVSR